MQGTQLSSKGSEKDLWRQGILENEQDDHIGIGIGEHRGRTQQGRGSRRVQAAGQLGLSPSPHPRFMTRRPERRAENQLTVRFS